MKRFILTVTVLCILFGSTFAQKASPTDLISEKQWSELFSSLSDENWDRAFALSGEYIKLLKDDDNAESIANLRYMLLFSAAGRVSEKKMGYDDLEKIAKVLVGKKLAFPFHPIEASCNGRQFNSICPTDKGKNKVMTASSNRLATTIFAFEYTDLKEDFDFAAHAGEMAAIIGTVKSIEPNPNRSTLVILRIYITDGSIVFRDEIKDGKKGLARVRGVFRGNVGILGQGSWNETSS